MTKYVDLGYNPLKTVHQATTGTRIRVWPDYFWLYTEEGLPGDRSDDFMTIDLPFADEEEIDEWLNETKPQG